MALNIRERKYLGISSTTGRASSPISGVRVHIEYRDEFGSRSSRTIRPLRYSRSYDGREFLRSWCETRHAERTFRVDRIISVHETDDDKTGSAAARPATSSATSAKLAIEPGRYKTAGSHADFVRYRTQRSTGSDSRSTYSKPETSQPKPASTKPKTAEPKEKHRVRKFIVRAAIAGLICYLWTEVNNKADPFSIRRPPVTQRIASTVATRRSVTDNFSVDIARISAFVSAILPSTGRLTSITERNSTGDVISARSTTRQLTHRGVSITESISGSRKRYGVNGYSTDFESIEHARAAANAQVFMNATGVSDRRVLELYLSADTNINGYMSWSELESFQRAADRRFRYSPNTTALRPDEFISAGGGDCEDWALLTAGLCRFWGWATYVGSIGPETGTGHAVCLVRMNLKPDVSYAYFHFPERTSFRGKIVPAGYYVPVDYEYVGRLSNAVKKGWRLRGIYEPESIYGKVM